MEDYPRVDLTIRYVNSEEEELGSMEESSSPAADGAGLANDAVEVSCVVSARSVEPETCGFAASIL